MKHLLLFLALSLSLVTGFCQNGWQWLNPKPTGNTCIKIKFADRQTGFILSMNGDLLKTTDQGGVWQRTDNFPGALCMDIAFGTGVIAGNNGVVYMSRDNGTSWSAVNAGTTDNLSMVDIVSHDTLFLGSANGDLYKTTDGGNNWLPLSCNQQVDCISFVDSRIGFAGGGGSSILKTVDGGQTWQTMEQSNTFPSSILSLQFLNTQTGFAIREYDDVQVTTDGGNTWATYNGLYQMTTIHMVDPAVGYIAGQDGAICRTADGGATWTPVIPPNGFKDGYQLYSIDFISADTGFTVGLEGRILKTVDGGNTWSWYSPTYLPIKAVSFPTPAVGYAADWNYTYKTTDSGRTWVPLSLTTGTAFGSQSQFEQAHFINPDTGYFISNNYFQIHTTMDGGLTWTSSNPAYYSVEDAPSLCFTDKNHGYLSVTNYNTGSIFKTADGGLTWTQIWGYGLPNAQPNWLGKVFYVDTLTAYAIASQTLYKSVDGGVTWQLIYDPSPGAPYSTLTDVCFVDRQTGFIGNDQDVLSVTHNGGSSWQTITTPYSSGVINTIRFFNPQIGFFADGNQFGPVDYGNIYKTVDGGQTWHKDMNFTGTGISFTADSSALISGFAGVLLKSSIRGFSIDSVSAGTGSDCNKELSAVVSATLGEVDSIAFEITGADGTVERVSANPGSVVNGQATCVAATPPLKPGIAYQVRLRMVYNGAVEYIDPLRFVASGLPKPSIFDSAGVLKSSVDSGNQWFLNGSAIANANQSRLIPKSSGLYTVQVTLGGCQSPMSDSMMYYIEHLGLRVYPNPATNYVTLVNTQNRLLNYRILSMTGRQMASGVMYWSYSTFDLHGFAPAEYVVEVVDVKSGEKGSVLFLKL